VLSIATQHEVPFYQARATFCRGWAMAAAGQGKEGIHEMQRSLSAFASGGALVPLFRAMLAESLGRNGHPEEGLSTVAEGLGQVETGERMAEAGLYRVKGELLLMNDPSDEVGAEHEFRIAIAIAQRQQARFWELRATTSLARLLKKQGKTDEARGMLAEIYNWFTEGFDTADLKDAKALLDELSL
jgi:predicted ATPase